MNYVEKIPGRLGVNLLRYNIKKNIINDKYIYTL